MIQRCLVRGNGFCPSRLSKHLTPLKEVCGNTSHENTNIQEKQGTIYADVYFTQLFLAEVPVPQIYLSSQTHNGKHFYSDVTKISVYSSICRGLTQQEQRRTSSRIKQPYYLKHNQKEPNANDSSWKQNCCLLPMTRIAFTDTVLNSVQNSAVCPL